MPRALPRAAGVALLALAIALPLAKNRDLVRRTEYAGMTELVADLDRLLPREALVFCEGRFLAYALEHFAVRQVVILDRLKPERAAGITGFIRRRLAAGMPVLLLTHAEVPWCEGLTFEPLFTRRFIAWRRNQELKAYPSSVRPIDLSFTGYRIGLLDDAAQSHEFPARVDVGENALGLGAGFSPMSVIAGGDKARWTGTAAEITVPWPTGDVPVEVVLRLASDEHRSAPAHTRFLLDGQAIAGETIVPDGMTEVRLQVSLPAMSKPRRALRIESTTWATGGDGDPQSRGVLLDWIEIRPLGPGAPQK
jgi:hypothetical protein